jgi:hypothetical protein
VSGIENLGQIFDYVQTAGLAGSLALCAKLYVDRRRLQIDAQSADLKIEEHRDGLTFDLLSAARTEVAALRQEVERLRPLDKHLQDFETALEHIEALMSPMNSADRRAAERSARAFLNRIRRLQEARGAITNEAQRLDSGIHVADRCERKEGEQGE